MKLGLWQERFSEYLRLRGCSARTVEAYSGELRQLFDFLQAGQIRSLAEVTKGHLEDYRSFLFSHEPPLKLTTQSVRMTAVKSFFGFLKRQDYLPSDPSRELPTIRIVRSYVRQILSEDEVKRVIESVETETAAGVRDRAILEIFYSSAIRNSELSSLKLDDVDAARSQLRILRGKGGYSRVIPLGQQALDWTMRYLETARPLLIKEQTDPALLFMSVRGAKLSREALSTVVRRAGERAGISAPVTPHVLRHSVATHMLARQAGIRYIQQLLGHESLESTQVYTRVEISQLQRMHQRFHPREQS